MEDCWKNRRPVNRGVHDKLLELFKLYLVVGGMPAAVQRYLDTNNISVVVAEQRAILREYRKDASKYDHQNKLKTEKVLDLIPEELRKENKRFFISVVLFVSCKFNFFLRDIFHFCLQIAFGCGGCSLL